MLRTFLLLTSFLALSVMINVLIVSRNENQSSEARNNIHSKKKVFRLENEFERGNTSKKNDEYISRTIEAIWKNCFRFDDQPLTEESQLLEHSVKVYKESDEFRNLPGLSYRGFRGPWIEQRWINSFEVTPLQDFLPWVPLFIQWTDYGARRGLKGTNRRYLTLKNWMVSTLRKDVLYFTVVQNDEGIGEELQLLFRNIFTISSGGYGYAKIPLLSRPLQGLPPARHDSDLLLFTGSLKTHALRVKCAASLRKQFKREFKMYEGKNWIKVTENSRFVLCPRGFGRSAFKLYETFDLRRVPVYIYDDIPWLPYSNTLAWNKLVISLPVSKLNQLPKLLNKVDEELYLEMISYAIKIHDEFFTFDGVLHKVTEFVKRPWSASITCEGLPRRVV